MRRYFLIILALFLIFINLSAEAAVSTVKREIQAEAKDGFNIKATLSYPKVKNQRSYSTVVLLHSLGYNSQWWESLPKELMDKGFAVLTVDLRGHGESVYNSRLAKVSWKSLKNTGYAKYPDDVLSVINKIGEDYPKMKFFNDWAIVGADIGASTGVIVADEMKIRPKTIIMISPVVKTKSLYIPVNVAHLDNVDFLSISGTDDDDSMQAANYLKKFAQADFTTFTSESKTTGMLMLKNDPDLSKMITEWINEYLGLGE